MANVSKNAEIRVLLNGQPEIGLIEWNDIEIVANYENDNVQPSLSIDSFNFKLNARRVINNWIANGLGGGVGIFEAMPFEIQIFNSTLTRSFKGYLDFTKDFKDFQDDGNISVSMMKEKGLDNFFAQIESLTFGYLENIGVVTTGHYTNIEYVVEKKLNIIELVMMTVTTYVLIKELVESIVSLIDTTVKTMTGSLPTIGIPPHVVIGAIIYAIFSLILRVIYIALIVIAIVNLGKQMFELFISPKRTHRMIKLRTALEVVCTHLGYNLDAPDTFFTNVYYLPSNPQLEDVNSIGVISDPNGIDKGIPNQMDYGYNCGEMFELAKRLINGRVKIVGNTIVLRSKKDTYWNTLSGFSRNNVLLNLLEYNTDELKPAKLIAFSTDMNDEFTIDNFNGTNLEVRTTQISTQNKDAVLLKGVEEIRFNVALGNRKNSLNELEKALQIFALLCDATAALLEGSSNLTGQITSKLGCLKVSSNWHTQPKLLYAVGGKIPTNHRTMLNAEKIYDDHHVYDSFVLNNFNGQKQLRNGVEIPFGFEDFNLLVDNAFCEINQKTVKLNQIKWKIGQDVAELNFEERKPYTINLSERKIIP